MTKGRLRRCLLYKAGARAAPVQNVGLELLLIDRCVGDGGLHNLFRLFLRLSGFFVLVVIVLVLKVLAEKQLFVLVQLLLTAAQIQGSGNQPAHSGGQEHQNGGKGAIFHENFLLVAGQTARQQSRPPTRGPSTSSRGCARLPRDLSSLYPAGGRITTF